MMTEATRSVQRTRRPVCDRLRWAGRELSLVLGFCLLLGHLVLHEHALDDGYHGWRTLGVMTVEVKEAAKA